MTTNIDITIQRPQREEDDNWPLIIEDEDQIISALSITFHDGASRETSKGSGVWEDVREWFLDDSTNLTEVYNWTDDETFREDEPFFACPKNVEVKIFSNSDSRVPADVIADEYGSSNAERWTRKPFATLTAEIQPTADPNHQWALGGATLTSAGTAVAVSTSHSAYNILCELLSKKDQDPPTAYVNPDLFMDGDNKRLKLKNREYALGSPKPLVYSSPPTHRKFGVRLSEKGAKSHCHYTDGKDETKYTREWLEGIHWCPVDTLDDTNYKVTRTPDYEAQETNGNFLDDGRWHVYLMPRRVAYYLRYRHHENTEEGTVTTAWTGLSVGCKQYLSDLCHGWPDADSPPAWNDSNTYGVEDCVEHSGVYYVCTQGNSGVEPGTDSTYWYALDLSEIMAHTHQKNQLFEATFTNTGVDPVTVEAQIKKSTHYVGLWWGRLPCDLSESYQVAGLDGGPVFPSTAEIKFFTSGNTEDGTLDVTWFETRDEARSNWIDAGGSSEDAAKTILSGDGTADLHTHRDAGSTFIRMADDDWLVTLDSIRNTMGCRPVDTSDTDRYDGATLDNEVIREYGGMDRLWAVIQASDFWTNVINPLRQASLNGTDDATPASRVDCLPFGVAFSPSKAGDLVAVFRKGGKAWFVWRKTDENLDSLMMTQGDSDNTGHCSFESSREDGMIDYFEEGSYPFQYGFTDDHLKRAYDADYADQFSGEISSATEWQAETEYTIGAVVTYSGVYYKANVAHTSGASWDSSKWDSLGQGSRKLVKVGRPMGLESQSIPSRPCAGEFDTSFAICTDEGQYTLAAPIYVMVSKERVLDDFTWKNDPTMWGVNILLRRRLARFYNTDWTEWPTAAYRNSF